MPREPLPLGIAPGVAPYPPLYLPLYSVPWQQTGNRLRIQASQENAVSEDAGGNAVGRPTRTGIFSPSAVT